MPPHDVVSGRGCLAALESLLHKVAGASRPGMIATAKSFREHVVAEAKGAHNERFLSAALSAAASIFRKALDCYHEMHWHQSTLLCQSAS